MKKLAFLALALGLVAPMNVFANNSDFREEVRRIFDKIKSKQVVSEEQTATTESAEENCTCEESNTTEEQVIAEENCTCEECNATEETTEITAIKAVETDEPKTAAEITAANRTCKINNKWNIEVLGWKNELSGHVKIAKDENTPVSDAAGRIDLKDETDLDKKTVPGIKLSYNANRRSTVEFNWTKIDQNGHFKNGVVKEFKGKSYAGNVGFDVNNSMYDLLWKYRLAHEVEECGREKSYVAALLGVKASQMEFAINGEATEVSTGAVIGQYSEDKKETIPVPYIGVEFGSYLGDALYLKGYVRYLKLNNIKDYDAKHCDYDVALSCKLSKKECANKLFLDIGYRQISYDVEGEGNDVELKYKGPYAGLEYQF